MGIYEWIFSSAGLKTACPVCGADFGKSQYNFCPKCKARLDTKMVLCTNCKRAIDPASSSCPHCQATVDAARAIRESTTLVWKRLPNQFGRRIDLNRSAFASKDLRAEGFIVEFGTKALLIVDGSLSRVLEPGRYVELQGETSGEELISASGKGVLDIISSAGKYVTVVLLQATDVDFKFAYGIDEEADKNELLISRDNLKIGLDCRVTLKLSNPANFYQNFMGAKDLVENDDIADYFEEEIRDAAREVVAVHDAEELIRADRKLKDSIQSEISVIINKTAQRVGLELIQVRAVFGHQAEIRELILKRGQAEAGRKRLEVLSQFKQFISSERAEEIIKKRDYSNFEKEVLAIDKERIISEEDFNEIKRAFEEGRGNREKTMEFLNKKLDIMHAMDLKRVQLIEDGKLQLVQIENEMRAFENQLKKQKMQAESDAEAYKKRTEAILEMYKKKKEIDVEALLKMPVELAALFLAENPNIAQVLIARTQASGNQNVIQAYEKIIRQMKDVAVAASTTRGSAAVDVVQKRAYDQAVDGKCPKCGYTGIESDSKICPKCEHRLS